MLKLDLKTEPYWLDLPGGIKIKVRPITTAIMNAAQTNSRVALRAMHEGAPVDPQLRSGLGDSLLTKALANLAIIEWEGVMLPDGTPAPVEEKTISQLMDVWIVAQTFMDVYIFQLKLLEFEGNVSAPAASGTSAAEAFTAGSAG